MAVYTTIDNPELYFQTKTYSGTGSSQSITLDGSEDMQPDWLWIKRRDSAANHRTVDSVRGVTIGMNPNQTIAEGTLSDSVTSFDSDGFSLGAGSQGYTNTSGGTFVAWCWKASGSTASNSDGTNITSTVSANTDAGFSIASYTGSGTDSDTVGHGLGSAPKMIILKKYDGVDVWYIMHTSLSTNNSLCLGGLDTNAQMTTSLLTYGVLSTSPTSSVFSFVAGGGLVPTGNVNNSGSNYIAYCFAEKQGFSKFGSYTGNGNADGTFVYTGFRPAFILTKSSSAVEPWKMWDNKRGSINPNQSIFWANQNDAEYVNANQSMDLLSNGFKWRMTDYANTGSATYIYMCFAEAPLVNSNGVPCNAR